MSLEGPRGVDDTRSKIRYFRTSSLVRFQYGAVWSLQFQSRGKVSHFVASAGDETSGALRDRDVNHLFVTGTHIREWGVTARDVAARDIGSCRWSECRFFELAKYSDIINPFDGGSRCPHIERVLSRGDIGGDNECSADFDVAAPVVIKCNDGARCVEQSECVVEVIEVIASADGQRGHVLGEINGECVDICACNESVGAVATAQDGLCCEHTRSTEK